jgi:tetratricopeptide (TPR) repeat protein
VAKYKKKRARELKHDRFRDTTMGLVDRMGNRLEGKGKTILYGLVGLVALGALLMLFNSWRARKNGEAAAALGRAIRVAEAPVTTTPAPGSTAPTFTTERARAEKAVEEFQKVASNYGGSTGEIARYFAATNRLVLDPDKGMSELEALTKSGDQEVSTLARFALAQAKESAGKLDDAAALYGELAKQNGNIITADTANVRLAAVYEKQGKKAQAADILFNLVETARKAKGKDNKPVPQSAAVRQAAQQLEKLDPERYAKLSPLPLPDDFSS